MPPTELRSRDTSQLVTESDDLLKSGKKLVGVNGNWYDVTNFIKIHPGGPIIEEFVGKDATDVFLSNGHKGVLKRWRPVGTYQMKERHPADKEFVELLNLFKSKGWFETSWTFYAGKLLFVYSLWTIVWGTLLLSENFYAHMAAGVVLAFFWQQTGFLMHECMHTTVFRNGFRDRFAGLILGTFNFGFSAHWWRDEHIVHHMMTNTVDSERRFADPQMWESVWAQNEKLYPLFGGLLQWCLVKIQHFTFIPMVTFIGRAEIIFDSYRVERRWYEWIAIVGHWCWMILMLSLLPNWKERIFFYCIAASVEGVFHFQLILSHYCKEFNEVSEFHKDSWYRFQIGSNMNIDSPTWLDWYYGGLNYHIEHHLYPLLGRRHLREASKYVRKVCEKYDIEYDSCSMTRALIRTLSHLKTCGTHYKLSFY
ncbi:unnamed protein product [Dimorphilus gyrociliatus]|uniref:Cytochrome b5 heme-binding domain-containing protein n=1 Tax=Dimorphilus gyrociliatus TaxID=2664684 RepID=A0A7I8VK59_9ANNE|nr:unnamed protein product [Dimorphilus gyrociliatus]